MQILIGNLFNHWMHTWLDLGPANIGLSQKSILRYFRTDDFKIFPENEIQYADVNTPLFWGSFAFASDVEDHISIVEGRFPDDAVSSTESTVEILVHENLALEFGLQVDETYIAYAQKRTGGTVKTIQIPVKIAGVWQPTNPAD